MLEDIDMFLRCFLVSKWLQVTPSTGQTLLLITHSVFLARAPRGAHELTIPQINVDSK